jgi:hypothetical protein
VVLGGTREPSKLKREEGSSTAIAVDGGWSLRRKQRHEEIRDKREGCEKAGE